MFNSSYLSVFEPEIDEEDIKSLVECLKKKDISGNSQIINRN